MNVKKFLAATLAFALLPIVYGETIGEIKFDQQGESRLTERQIYFNTKLRTGQEFSAKTLDDDIKRLYNSGQFADISAVSEKMADGRVRLIFKLRLQPKVAKFAIVGNQKFTAKELNALVSVSADSPLNNANLRDSINKIREFYKEKGYNDARISPEIKTTKNGRVEVTIKINENLRLRVDNVTFSNNTVISSSALKDAIANRYSLLGSLPWVGKYLNAGLLDRKELEIDKSRLRDLYLAKGYLDFKVEKVTITQNEKDPELVNLDFVLFEGAPYTISNIKLSGAGALPLADSEQLIRLKAGEVFNGDKERESEKAIIDLYESHGFSDINVRAVRHADFATHKVELDFIITEGRKYSVRDVVITGNIYTKDKVIRRELVLQPGDPVDRNRIEASKERLIGMGYFNSVETSTVNADAVDEKDIHIKVEEKDERFNAKIGAGFSDVNSLVGMAEISSNNFDIMNPGNWFYGGGQRMRIQGLFGIERMGFNIDFTEPWFLDQQMRLDVSFYGNESEFDYWNERRYGGRVSLSRRIFDDFTTGTVAYKLENVNVFDMSHKLAPATRELKGHEWVSQLSFLIDRDTRDSLMFPTTGYNVNFLAAVSPKIFGSSQNFYRLEIKGSYYHSFFDKAIIAMAGMRAGVVSNFNRSEQAPLYERYFLGGGDSLRGFYYREVSPLDANGRPTGGDTMLLGTFEVSHPIWNFIRGAAFVDVGNVWRYSYNFQLSDINVGAGYGLRIKLPMLNAPIKLDLAYPVVNNQDNVSSKLRFHFNMGFTW